MSSAEDKNGSVEEAMELYYIPSSLEEFRRRVSLPGDLEEEVCRSYSTEDSQLRIDSDAEFGVPMCIFWSPEMVADFIVDIGFPQYKVCFEKNFIAGRHLFGVDASALTAMGVHDFDHIKAITANIRGLLGLEHVITDMAEALRDPMIAYLDQKRRSGKRTEWLTYRQFLKDNERWYK